MWIFPGSVRENLFGAVYRLISRAHQGEPLSPILGLGVNPFDFPSRSINITPPSVRVANQNRVVQSLFYPHALDQAGDSEER